jgi:cell pole-organizing protein PopZ
MEEILASIRRIIADDEAKPAAAPTPVAAPAPAAVAPKSEPAKAAAPAAKAPVMSNSAAAPAVKPAPPPPAAAPSAAESNSQDDIDALLAGLEEVTAEEEVRPPPRAAAPVPPPPPAPEEEVFELTDEMALPDPPPAAEPAFQPVEADNDVEFAEAVRESLRKEPAPAPAWEPPAVERAAPAVAEMPIDAPILSRSTVAAVDSAFNTLAHTVLSNNARTLEDLVKEMLRPMLKSWLDDNLPQLVERIVRAEIERVSRGR